MASNNRSPARLSVIYVNYNATEYLLRSLVSLRDELQRSADLLSAVRVIVVDNGSSAQSLKPLQCVDGIDVVALDNNIGFAGANNVALRRFPADLYLLLNPDTVLLPGCLRRLLNVMGAHEVAMSAPILINADGSLQSAGYRFPTLVSSFIEAFPLSVRLYNSRLNARARLARVPYEVDYVLGAAMLVSDRAVAQVGLLDDGYFMYSEEVDWCHRFRNCGWKIVVHPDAVAIHLGGRSTRQLGHVMWYHLQRSRYLYYSKYYPRAFLEGHRWITRLGILRLACSAWVRWRKGTISLEERDALWRLYGRVFRL